MSQCHVGPGYIACTRGPRKQKCSFCGNVSTLLCDFPVAGGTCDKPLCRQCARSIGPNVDHCFAHVVLGEKES